MPPEATRHTLVEPRLPLLLQPRIVDLGLRWRRLLQEYDVAGDAGGDGNYSWAYYYENDSWCEETDAVAVIVAAPQEEEGSD